MRRLQSRGSVVVVVHDEGRGQRGGEGSHVVEGGGRQGDSVDDEGGEQLGEVSRALGREGGREGMMNDDGGLNC